VEEIRDLVRKSFVDDVEIAKVVMKASDRVTLQGGKK
jgi:hypothetical protein